MTDRELLEILIQKVTNMESEQQTLKQEVTSIKETMATKAELAEIRETMATKTELAEIRETMATKEDVADIPAMKQAIFEISDTVKRIEGTLQEHDLTLTLLSRRSIDQEAKIR